HYPLPILGNHRPGPAQKIAKIIREVTVPPLDNGVVAEIAILAENHFAQEVVPQQLRTEDFVEYERIDNIAARFGHFLSTDEPEPMCENALRNRQARCHQESRPVYSVEAYDFFADEVQLRRPVF